MAEINLTTMGGLAKVVYEDKNGFYKHVPDDFRIQKLYPFNQQSVGLAPGASFNIPWEVAKLGGGTWGGEESEALVLDSPISNVVVQATIKPSIFGQAYHIGYPTITQIGKAKTKGQQKKAFLDHTSLYVDSAAEVAEFHLELALLYGGSLVGCGIVSGVSVSGTTNTVTLSPATFNEYIWQWMGNGWRVDVWDTTGATQRNATSEMTVTGWSTANKTITIECANTTELGNIAATDFVVPKGLYDKAFKGIHYPLANTSGSYLGQSVSTYPLLLSNTYNCQSAPLSVGKIKRALSKTRRGGSHKMFNLLCHPDAEIDVSEGLSSNIVIQKGEGEWSEKIQKITIGRKTVNIEPHDLVMPGYAYLLPARSKNMEEDRETIIRVGPTDTTLRNALGGYFAEIGGTLGLEGKAWSHQAMMIKKPASCCLLYGITNQTS